MFNDARTQLEIRSASDYVRKSRLIPFLIVVIITVALASGFLGKYLAKIQWQDAVQSLYMIEEEHAAVLVENKALKESLEFEKARNSRDLQIKLKAYDEVARALEVTSREIANLKENVRFYESVIEGDESKQGLQIKDVSLYENGTAGHYRYKVVVVNSNIGKRKSKGILTIELEGLQAGELKTVKIPGIKSGMSTPLLFKYFQRIDGVLIVPDGFNPQRIHVSASLTSGKTAKKEKWYNWNILLNRAMSAISE